MNYYLIEKDISDDCVDYGDYILDWDDGDYDEWRKI